MKTQKAAAKKAASKKEAPQYVYAFSVESTPFCCGVIEVGDLDLVPATEHEDRMDFEGEYSGTQKETQQRLKNILRRGAFGLVSFPVANKVYKKWYEDIIEAGFKVLYKATPRRNPQSNRNLTTVIFVNK